MRSNTGKSISTATLMACLVAAGCGNSGQPAAVGSGGASGTGGAAGSGVGSGDAGASGGKAGGAGMSGGTTGGTAGSRGGIGTDAGAGGGGPTGGASGAAGAGAGAQGGAPGAGGGGPGGGNGGKNGAGGAGGDGAAVDGWYEAEAVPPNVLTYAATVSHSDEGKNMSCPLDATPGISAARAHGVSEGADCASAGGMVVNILGRSPCNPETPSSYSNCQNLGAGVELHNVTVPADGMYDVTWWYHCGLNDHYGDNNCGGVHYSVGSSCRPHLIDVNGTPMSATVGGQKALFYQFPCYAGAWSIVHGATTTLPLKAGATGNVIYIHAPGATTLDAADIDAINVLPQGKGASPVATPVVSGD
jgi:hypothetical protein